MALNHFVSLCLCASPSFLLDPLLFIWIQFNDLTNGHAHEHIRAEGQSRKSDATVKYIQQSRVAPCGVPGSRIHLHGELLAQPTEIFACPARDIVGPLRVQNLIIQLLSHVMDLCQEFLPVFTALLCRLQ